MTKTIVLTFHAFLCDSLPASLLNDPAAMKYVLSPEVLKGIAASLEHSRVCTLASAHGQGEGGQKVVLTFDDGYVSDWLSAFPVLAESGLVGTFFVTSDNIGKPGYCSAEQLRKMASSGMEIASHGRTHRYLTVMSDAEARREIVESAKKIEDATGVRVCGYAAVGGHYDSRCLSFAREAGYTYFASMIPGANRLSGKRFPLIRRNHIQQGHDTNYIQNLIRGDAALLFRNRVRYQALALPKKLLGLERYDRAKNLLLGRSA